LSQSGKLAIGLTFGLVCGLPLLVLVIWYIISRSKTSNNFSIQSGTSADVPSAVTTSKQTYEEQKDEDGDESVEINHINPSTSDDA